MTYTLAQLQAEIARRAPWYQCISFPDHGISTTDHAANAMLDGAWDNKTDHNTIEEAARLRPRPKWDAISTFLPPLQGLEVLEIGSNCGFFSFEFARRGAKSVTGLDVAPKWLDNAEWARTVLGFDNVRFFNCDFMRYDGLPQPAPGLLSSSDWQIPLPDRQFDLVFMSTVLDHLFFPLFAIYKMCRISRQWVVIDVPTADVPAAESMARLSVAADQSHHGFTFSPKFLTTYIGRLGIPAADIQTRIYNGGRNVSYIVDVRRFSQGLQGA